MMSTLIQDGLANTGDYADTPEQFGTGTIHTNELDAAVNSIVITAEAKAGFT